MSTQIKAIVASWCALFVLCCPIVFGQTAVRSSRAPARDQKQALRQRAERYYRLLKDAEGEKAALLVSASSRDYFNAEYEKNFGSYEIQSVEISPSGKRGVVSAKLTVMPTVNGGMPPMGAMPFPNVPGTDQMGAPAKIPMVPIIRKTKWLLYAGRWYLDATPQKTPSLMEVFAGGFKPPPPQLDVSAKWFAIGKVKPGTVAHGTIPFTNKTDHPVTIVRLSTMCPCGKATSDKKQYLPGESGKIELEVTMPDEIGEFTDSLSIVTDPPSGTLHVNMAGTVVPKDYKPPEKTAAENAAPPAPAAPKPDPKAQNQAKP